MTRINTAHIIPMAEYWCNQMVGTHYLPGHSKPVHISARAVLRWVANSYRISLPSSWVAKLGSARMFRTSEDYWSHHHDDGVQAARQTIEELPRLNKALKLRRNKEKIHTKMRKLIQDARNNISS